MTALTTRDIVLIALFTAVTAGLGAFPPVTLAAGVPITAQTLGVMLAGGILGAVRGGLAILLFIVLVAVGVPILAGGRGGFGMLLGPSGGFLLAWPVTAFLIGLAVERLWSRLTFWHALAVNLLIGIGVLYACGVPWMAMAASMPLDAAAVIAAGFIPGDIIKAALAAFVVVTLKRSYPIISTVQR